MDPLLRIFDANLNRAREALRVLEECARFALHDRALVTTIKGARHALRAAAATLAADRLRLLANRDTPGDPGTDATTASEFVREDLPAVAAAAASRLTESLRVLEETAKALADPAAARRIERVRYEAYDIDKLLTLALGTGRARQWRLCVLLTESLCAHHPWDRVAALALEGGADSLQLREKALDARELTDRARRLIEIARPAGAAVIINDRADAALASGADGVHLGQGDAPVRDVRALAGRRLLVGVSTADMDQARAAAGEGADYCGVGPMFPSTTKTRPHLAGPDSLRAYLADEQTARIPHLAIGGITPTNVRALADAGCRGIAVSSAVCAAQDPAAVCRSMLEALPR